MILKQYALSEIETDVLYDLVLHELRTKMVFGENMDMVELTKVLIKLHDQLEHFSPPEPIKRKQKRAIEKAEEETADADTAYRKARQISEGDLQT